MVLNNDIRKNYQNTEKLEIIYENFSKSTSYLILMYGLT